MATTVEEVLFEGDRCVGVRAQPRDEAPYEIRSKVVVDASGARTVIGSQLGLKQPVPGLNKASIWSYYQGGKRLTGIDAGETTIFMLPDGAWFWYIPLPDDIVSVGIVGSPELLFAESTDFEAVFQHEVERCAPLLERLSEATRTEAVRGIRRLAYRNQQTAGNGWVMVGDAATFLDPIYSSGLFLALGSAELAANCIHQGLSTDDLSADSLGAFAEMLGDGIEVIRRLIHAFYDPEFSFRKFVVKFPEHRAALIDCLVGDVIEKDMGDFLGALAEMTPPPPAW